MTNQPGANHLMMKGDAGAGTLRPRPDALDREHALCYDELWCAVTQMAVMDYKRWLAQASSVDVLLAIPSGGDAYSAWHFIFHSRLYEDLTLLMPGLNQIREHLDRERTRRRELLEEAGRGQERPVLEVGIPRSARRA